jgi:hypothetical protein
VVLEILRQLHHPKETTEEAVQMIMQLPFMSVAVVVAHLLLVLMRLPPARGPLVTVAMAQHHLFLVLP